MLLLLVNSGISQIFVIQRYLPPNSVKVYDEFKTTTGKIHSYIFKFIPQYLIYNWSSESAIFKILFALLDLGFLYVFSIFQYRLNILMRESNVNFPKRWIDKTGAPNEISWQISATQPTYSWLARETEQIQNPSWQAENIKNLWI